MILDAQTIPWLVLGVCIFLFVLVYIRAFFTWIGGAWYEKKDENSAIQEIQLKQLGPFIWGKTKVKGGELLFRGWFNGTTLTMRRRDYGKDYLRTMGFPDSVINELNGSEMAKMQFVLNGSKGLLEGKHFPQKIEISRTRPPRILERGYLPPTERNWSRNAKAFDL